ncbi:MAG: TraR/DksA C4-type zinc finger protein [Halobacteriovoraceae bacterium]|nr:TraR/DksA C4-type zinc finger protein [Halobacteriovoraceae bacterium]
MTRQELIKKCESRLLGLKHKYTRYLDIKAPLYREGVCITTEAKVKGTSKRSDKLKLITEIMYALRRIKEGRFGICESTGKEIDREKLILKPWTRFC